MQLDLHLVEESNLGIYLREISRYSPLSREEEFRLAARISQGDKRALRNLVVANLRFVVSVARNYQHQGLALSDLINEGNLGLLRASTRFDHRKNFKFISYAVWWIRQAILQALANQSRIVRLPLNRVGSIYQIGKARRVLEQRERRLPSTEEIAQEIDLREGEVQRMMEVAAHHASLDAPLGERGGASLHDALHDEGQQAPDDALTRISLRREVEHCFRVLEPREQEVLKLYFGIDYDAAHTLDDIGRLYHLTRERVRQIKDRALSKLRASAGSDALSVLRQ